MTVLWRAAESARDTRLFVDSVAEEVAKRLPPWPRSLASETFADIVAVRTRQLDGIIASAVACGIDQIVVLGAGIDTRFWRVPLPRGTPLIEIDSAGVNDLARQLLPAGGLGRRVAAQLPRELITALDWAEHDPDRRTLWVAEGLVEYLPGSLWPRLIAVLTTRSAPGSMALITVLGDVLPKRFAHDPAFPFRRLRSVPQLLSSIPQEWEVDIAQAQQMRTVSPSMYTIISLRRPTRPHAT
jgi:methyltransferase (TIGR00027 family)